MKGKVVAICRSQEKGKPKEDVGSGFLEKDFGLVGDAHAGTPQQISILIKEKVDQLARQATFAFPPGAFAENLLISGLRQEEIIPAKILRVGGALLQVVRIGKEPNLLHSYNYRGYSLLPQYGIFARVLKSGIVKNSDEVEVLD